MSRFLAGIVEDSIGHPLPWRQLGRGPTPGRLAAQKQAQAGDAHAKEIEQQAAAKVAEAEEVRVATQSQHTSDLKQAADAGQEAEQTHEFKQQVIKQSQAPP